jgi:hypothetical protein
VTKREMYKKLQVMVRQRIDLLDKGYSQQQAPLSVQHEMQGLAEIEDWLCQEVNGLNIKEYPHEQWSELRP